MKKLLSTMLAGTLLVTSMGLTGCQKNSGSKTLKWVQLGDKQQRNEEILAKANEIIEPELGMKLEIEYIDSASFSQKSRNMMAAGEDFDIMWTGYLNDYQSAVNLGGLADITKYIDNIKMADGKTVKMSDVVEQYLLDSAYVDGSIYGIPNTQVVSNPFAMKIRKSVADECGVDIDGLEEAALTVKDGETAKAYMDKVSEEFEKIHAKRPDLNTFNPGTNMASVGVYEEIVKGVGIRKDGSSKKIVNLRETDEWIAGVDAARTWYENGYIRKDIASKGNALVSADEQKQYGVTQTTWKPGQDVLDADEMGEDVVYSLVDEPYVSRTNPLATMLSVGADSKHPKEAVKLIYMLNSNKELYNLLCWGIKDTDYKVNSDGTITEIKKSGYDDVGANAWRYGNQFNSLLVQGQESDVWEQTKKMNDDAVKSPVMGFVPNTDSITTELSNITNVIAEYKAKEEFGTVARSEYWDEFMKKLDTAGINKVVEEIQKQYDEFRSK